MDDNDVRVHATHCCKFCGCKYGDEDCPVVNGVIDAEYPCEYCTGNSTRDEEVFKLKRYIRVLENESIRSKSVIKRLRTQLDIDNKIEPLDFGSEPE